MFLLLSSCFFVLCTKLFDKQKKCRPSESIRKTTSFYLPSSSINSTSSDNPKQIRCSGKFSHSRICWHEHTLPFLECQCFARFSSHCSATGDAEQHSECICGRNCCCNCWRCCLQVQSEYLKIGTRTQNFFRISVFLFDCPVLFRQWLLLIVHRCNCLFDVQRTLVPICIRAVIVIQAIGQVGTLLNLCKQNACSNGMHRSGWNQERIVLGNGNALQIRFQCSLCHDCRSRSGVMVCRNP